jgi:hypothetical protein
MKGQQIQEYREKIEKHLIDKVTEIDSTLSLIILGTLGFTISKLDKDFGEYLKSIWFWVSFCSLVIAFLCLLLHKYLTQKFDEKIIDFLDNMTVDNESDDVNLDNKWKNFKNVLDTIRNFTFFFVGLGIFSVVIFFLFMYPIKKNEEEISKPNIQIINNYYDTLAYLKSRKDTLKH